MNLPDIAIRNPVFAWMLMTALILFGALSFQKMGVSQLPDVDYPVVSVSAIVEGAAPEVMESTVVEPIEDALMLIAGIEGVTSSSKAGKANITVEFNLDKDIDVAVQEVQAAISGIQRWLPRDMETPTVHKVNPEDHPIVMFTVSSETMTRPQLMEFTRDFVKDKFSTVEGVGDIFLAGYIEPNMRIWVSGNRLNRYALAATDLISAIQEEHLELPAGRIETKEKEWNVRLLGEAQKIDDFARMVIQRRGGTPVFSAIRLSDVATIEEGLADARGLSRAQGKVAVGLGIRKQRGANLVSVATATKAKMEEVRSILPKGTQIDVRFDSSKFIQEAIHEMYFILILSAILTSIVCWFFLGSWSGTFNVILAIPTSIVGSFIILSAFGFTLNLFTLLGLSLAIGIVVDDAIMVLENIVRHKSTGLSRVEAARRGSREIMLAALASTAAIIAIFLPVAFMEGMIGKYFFQFGVTLSVAVALSLFEALTFTPMRCSQFIEEEGRATRVGRLANKTFEVAAQGYRRILEVLLNHRWKTIGAAIVFFVCSLVVVRLLKVEYMPQQDQGMLLLRIKTPVGSSLEYTDNRFKEVESLLMKHPEIDDYFVAIGGFGGGEVDNGMAFITLKPRDARPRNPKTGHPISQAEAATALRAELKQFKDIQFFIQDMAMEGLGGRRGYPVAFTIRGPEWNRLVEFSDAFKEKMKAMGKVADIDSDYRPGMPEVQITPNRERARLHGVSVSDINQTVQALVGGAIVGKYSKGSRRQDIRLQLVAEERSKIEDLSSLMVRNNRGELVPLSSVVNIDQRASAKAISHEDRERAISIFANVAPGSSQNEAMNSVKALASEILPKGYRIEMTGSSKQMYEAFRGLIFALILGIIVSYMVLASQFNSYLDPWIVLVALPFSVSGAFVSLLIGGETINLYSMIGLILLMGIVKKNSILLVDFTNRLREQGESVRDALLKACPIRLRPILMTSISTIAAAVPAAIAFGPGAESRVPMATAVIGGMIVSTVLTLFVVPCFYSLVARTRRLSRVEAQAA